MNARGHRVTRTLREASSLETDLVKPIRPALDAV